jgi:surfactin synthase thioesterase subunit
LFVSAARAPQFRLGHQPQPDPDDATLIQELQGLESVPAEVLDNPELMRLMMPTVRADTRLYRNYVYRPEQPLSIPIYAFGGIMDPNVSPEHIAAWREQTTGPFAQEHFAGGHFFIRTSQNEVVASLRNRLWKP